MDSPRDSNSDHSEQDEYEDNDYKDRIAETSPKGRFIRFNEELGFGAYKTVYRAYDNDSGCEVAWNVIKLQRLPPNERKRISEEISLLKNLHHLNIINFINAWINKSKNEVVFITECVSGGSLKKHLKKIKKPRLKIIKNWCRQILKGLNYLHDQKPFPIIHRDIKAENVFINTTSNEIRIGDLGLAVSLQNSSHTTSVIGTPEFMAPEIYEEKYGTPVDIYSFGMCVLEMATLSTPYKECTSAAQVYKKVSKGILPYQIDLIQNEGLKSLILKCLSHYKDRPSAQELLNHKFLDLAEQEEDNYPVQLFDPNNLSIQSCTALNTGGGQPEQASLILSKSSKLKESSPAHELVNNEEVLQNEESLTHSQTNVLSDSKTLTHTSSNKSLKMKKNKLTIDIIDDDNGDADQPKQQDETHQSDKQHVDSLTLQSSQNNSTQNNIQKSQSLQDQSYQQQQSLQPDLLDLDLDYKTPQNIKGKQRDSNNFDAQIGHLQNSTSYQEQPQQNISNSIGGSQIFVSNLQNSENQVDLNESSQNNFDKVNIQKAFREFTTNHQQSIEVTHEDVSHQNHEKEQENGSSNLKENDGVKNNTSQLNSSNFDLNSIRYQHSVKMPDQLGNNIESQDLLSIDETPQHQIQDQSAQQISLAYQTNDNDQIKNTDTALKIVKQSSNNSYSSQSSINQGIYLYNMNYSLQINEYSQETSYRYTVTLEVKDSLYPFDFSVEKGIINGFLYTKQMICGLIKEALNQIECQELEKIHTYIIDDTYNKFQEFQNPKKNMSKKPQSQTINQISPIKSSNGLVELTPNEKIDKSQNQITTPSLNAMTAVQTIQDELHSHHEVEEVVHCQDDSQEFNKQDYQYQGQPSNLQEQNGCQLLSQGNYQNQNQNTMNTNLRNDRNITSPQDPNMMQQINQQQYLSQNPFSFPQNNQQLYMQKQNFYGNQPTLIQQSFNQSMYMLNQSSLSMKQQQQQMFPIHCAYPAMFSTLMPFPEKGQTISPHLNFHFSKIIESFITYYKQYWEVNFELMLNESQELMKFRQQKELIELQKLHIIQNDQWLTHQMSVAQYQQDYGGVQFPGKQAMIQQQQHQYPYQGEQVNVLQSNHSVLDISNISNVKEVENDNHISPQLKDSIDMDLSNMLSDNPTHSILGNHTNQINKQTFQQSQQVFPQNNISMNNAAINNFGNAGGQVMNQFQPEFLISPQNRSIGNQQFIQNLQSNDAVSNSKKVNNPIKATGNIQLNESILLKQQSQSNQIKNNSQLQQVPLNPIQQQQQQTNLSMNLANNPTSYPQSFGNSVQLSNSDQHRQSLLITQANQNQTQTPSTKTNNPNQIPIANQATKNQKQVLERQQSQQQTTSQQTQQQVLQQQQLQTSQQLQTQNSQQYQQLQQQQQQLQVQQQQNMKMNSKPPTPKQVSSHMNQQTNNNSIPQQQNSQNSNSQVTQQPLKPIKPTGQQAKPNYQNTHHLASNSQDLQHYANDSNQLLAQQPPLFQPQIKSSQNLKNFQKCSTPQHTNVNEQNQNTASKINLIQSQNVNISINNTSLNNQSLLLNSSFKEGQLQLNLKSDQSELCQLQKPLTKLTKKASCVVKHSLPHSNQDLSSQDYNLQEKKDSANKNQNQLFQFNGPQLNQLGSLENKDQSQNQQQQLQQQQILSASFNQQLQQQQPSIQQQQQMNQNSSISIQQQHQAMQQQYSSHHHHSAVFQKSNQPQQQQQNQNFLGVNQIESQQKAHHKSTSQTQNTSYQPQNQQQYNDQNSVNSQIHSQTKDLSSQINQQADQLNTFSQLNDQKKVQFKTFEATNTPQFSPLPSKQNSNVITEDHLIHKEWLGGEDKNIIKPSQFQQIPNGYIKESQSYQQQQQQTQK